MMTAAFFDLDNTIVDTNCGLRLIVHYFFRGHVSPYQALRMGLGYLTLYIAKRNPIAFFRNAFHFMKGKDQKEEISRCAAYFEKHLKKKIYKEALKLIEWHRKQKHLVVVITNSLEFKVARIKEIIKADVLIASKLETLKGRFTGKTARVAFGKNKAKLVREIAKRMGIDLERSFAYSDNSSDIPLLRTVGNPVAVNPQWGMRRYAEKMDWKILRFSKTGG